MKNNGKTGTVTTMLLTAFLFITSLSSFIIVPSTEKNAEQHYTLLDEANLAVEETDPFAKVILYRPDNQLTRPYKVSTNTNGTFEMAKREVVTIEANSDVFTVSVDAVGHQKASFTFNLIQNKTHYFRIQDRNNYSGFRAFLEVIEVTEETFKREKY